MTYGACGTVCRHAVRIPRERAGEAIGTLNNQFPYASPNHCVSSSPQGERKGHSKHATQTCSALPHLFSSPQGAARPLHDRHPRLKRLVESHRVPWQRGGAAVKIATPIGASPPQLPPPGKKVLQTFQRIARLIAWIRKSTLKRHASASKGLTHPWVRGRMRSLRLP